MTASWHRSHLFGLTKRLYVIAHSSDFLGARPVLSSACSAPLSTVVGNPKAESSRQGHSCPRWDPDAQGHRGCCWSRIWSGQWGPGPGPAGSSPCSADWVIPWHQALDQDSKAGSRSRAWLFLGQDVASVQRLE